MGRGPIHRSPPSSAATSSCRGPAGTQPPAVEGAANLEAITAGKRGAIAPGLVTVEHQHAQSLGRAHLAEPLPRSGAAGSLETDYVPVWMRTPSWLYLPHLEPTAPTLHAGTDGTMGRTAAADRDAEPPEIRGRVTSPGTRKISPLDRARERLAARNAHLATSLNLHAERVEKKRKSQAATDAGTATAAERLAAVRRRLYARMDKGAAHAAAGCEVARTPSASEEVAGPERRNVGQEQPREHATDAEDGSRRSGGDASAVPQAGDHWTQEGAGMQHVAQEQSRQMTRNDSAARSEEVDTPETGAWSIEDLKMHYNQLHAVRIRMTTACTRRGHSGGDGGADGAAESTGEGVEQRPLEAEGRRGGHVAPPNAASAAAASHVAWHTTAAQVRNDR